MAKSEDSTPKTSAADRALALATGPSVPPWMLVAALVFGVPAGGLVGGNVASSQYVTRADMDRISQKVDTLDQKLTELRIAIALATQKDPG